VSVSYFADTKERKNEVAYTISSRLW